MSGIHILRRTLDVLYSDGAREKTLLVGTEVFIIAQGNDASRHAVASGRIQGEVLVIGVASGPFTLEPDTYLVLRAALEDATQPR